MHAIALPSTEAERARIAQVVPAPLQYAEPIGPRKPVKTYGQAVLCNCYRYVAEYIEIPRMAEILKTATPAFGNVAVFDYNGVPHFAIVTGMGVGTFDIRESNYTRCALTERTISFADPNLVGFYNGDLLP
jgi:hypothetical protein